MVADEFDDGNGGKRDDLVISRFFNSIKEPTGNDVIGFFEDPEGNVIELVEAVQ